MSNSPPTYRLALRGPAVRGALLAVTAALLFGASTPFVQRFGSGVGAFATAALLYMGAAAAGALLRQRVEHEARVLSGDFPRLLAMAAAGAVIGPVALAWGLQRTSATSASLMLTLEAVFTAVLAWRMYHETMDRRVWTAMLLLVVGGALLIVNQGHDSGAGAWGLLAVLLATATWGLDNTLSRGLAERDPGQVVLAKAVLGATATSMLAVAGVLMLAGVVLHLVESHGHEHQHEPTEHEHAHRHDDGHHGHLHDPVLTGAHSHLHRHEPLRHVHPHVPDAHHAHRH
jgi:drug/metabolite transporter (DMT)-like permease